MSVLIDPPNAAGHGRLWSHLASDASYDELHAFARGLGIPARGFDRDHYDVPAEWYDRVVEAGARPVTSRELIDRLVRAGLRRRKGDVLGPRGLGSPLVRPPRLAPGDQVAVVTPAGGVDPSRLAAGIDVLRGWGLEVRDLTRRPGSLGWLAGSDEERAEALVEAWVDAEVRAVWCARGGFGTHRVLDLLDWDRLAQAGPRLLVGFSDATALHQAVAARLGLVSVHGPGVAGLGDRGGPGEDATRDAVASLVLDGAAVELRGVPGGGGQAEGVLVGGNVAVLAGSVGTPHVQPAAGAIALLEDVGERPYRLDRALTQLLRSGWFDGVRGVVCGTFTDCGPPHEVRELLAARLGPLGVPLVYDVPVGHGAPNLAVPLGAAATLDAESGTLTWRPPTPPLR
ncbi:DUF4031 domain-containing protein [Nocardioides pacificus]